MNANEYISEFLKHKPIRMDELNEVFLWLIMEEYSSSYKLHCFLKQNGGAIAYKNVNARVHRLYEAGLIEKVRKKVGFHNAVNYRLTARGLVYIFSELMSPSDAAAIILSHSENILFETFVYPYFERRTLKRATYTFVGMLENYIREACQNIRYFLNPDRIALYSNDPSFLIEVLEFQLNWHVRSFILKLSTMKEGFTDWREWPYEKVQCTPEEDKSKTFSLLSRDKKFMRALKEAEGELREGYEMLIKKQEEI